MLKKLLVVLAAFLMLAGCSKDDRPVLKVYNWGEYIDKAVITSFEKEFNVRVRYETFASNEEMYIKITGGEVYDVLVPSDYMVQRLIQEERIQKLDYSKIPNYANIDDAHKNSHVDPTGEYTVPYFVGSVGIVYNKENISLSDLESKGWEILRDEKHKDQIFFYDSERDAFMVALKALGYSMNTDDVKELQEAHDWLVDMKKKVNPVYVTDLVIGSMEAGERDLAVMYSGDAAAVLNVNKNLGYYEPKQGTNVWIDTMIIPNEATEVDLAHQFINYISKPENSALISEEVGYTSPIKAVVDELTAPGGTYEGNSAYTPRSGYDKDEQFFYNEQTKKIMSDLWSKVIAAN